MLIDVEAQKERLCPLSADDMLLSLNASYRQHRQY